MKTALGALQHQVRLGIRFTAYEKKMAALEAKETEVEHLKTPLASLRAARTKLCQFITAAIR